MDTAIVAAWITVAGAIVAALIGIFVKQSNKKNRIIIKQKSKGNSTTQIGIQNNYGGKNNE
jgi:hypothetical protein